MKPRYLIALLVVLALLSAACDSGEVQLSTTSSLITGTTEPPPEPTTTTTEATATSTTLRGETVGEYEVLVRVSTDNGDVFYIVVPPGAYTDIDLENFISDLRTGNPELWGAEVFDDEEAIEAFQVPEDQRTEEQSQLLADHHFVSLVGDILRFQGPFAEFGEMIIGS